MSEGPPAPLGRGAAASKFAPDGRTSMVETGEQRDMIVELMEDFALGWEALQEHIEHAKASGEAAVLALGAGGEPASAAAAGEDAPLRQTTALERARAANAESSAQVQLQQLRRQLEAATLEAESERAARQAAEAAKREAEATVAALQAQCAAVAAQAAAAGGAAAEGGGVLTDVGKLLVGIMGPAAGAAKGSPADEPAADGAAVHDVAWQAVTKPGSPEKK